MKVTVYEHTEDFGWCEPIDLWAEAREWYQHSLAYYGEEFVADFRAQAVIEDRHGEAITGANRQRLIDRFEGTWSEMPAPRTLADVDHERERRWLIPGLQPWGTIPMLGGPPKVGKTLLAIDYAAALILNTGLSDDGVDPYRFLGHFAPATLTSDERERGVWIINAETPAEDFDAALAERGLILPDEGLEADEQWGSLLHVEHLEALGGPGVMDLTNTENFDRWFNRFITCEVCDGSDFAKPPIAVIVDGITAILGGSTERYGQWYAAFRRLLRSLDIPNGLVTGHNTLAGGHLMGGVEAQAGADGLWNLTRRGQDNAHASRSFSVIPRLGGKAFGPRRVELVEGRLRVAAERRKPEGGASEPQEEREPEGPSVRDRVLEFIRASNEAGDGPSARGIREGVDGSHEEIDAARAALKAEGLIQERPRQKRGGGFAYWSVPPAPTPTDAEVS